MVGPGVRCCYCGDWQFTGWYACWWGGAIGLVGAEDDWVWVGWEPWGDMEGAEGVVTRIVGRGWLV